jgi:hypothetical protein
MPTSAQFSKNRHSKGQLLLSEADTQEEPYNDGVQYYTAKRTNGGITFKCMFCEHLIATLDFDPTKGNLRTQAATAMNQHARRLHLSHMPSVRPWDWAVAVNFEIRIAQTNFVGALPGVRS